MLSFFDCAVTLNSSCFPFPTGWNMFLLQKLSTEEYHMIHTQQNCLWVWLVFMLSKSISIKNNNVSLLVVF